MSEIIQVTGRQIAAARALVGLDQATLADSANVSVQTLRRMEATEGPPGGYPNNIAAVRAALEKAGVDFIDENGGGAGVRLRKGHQVKDQFVVEEADETSIRIRALSTADRFSFVIKDRKIGSAAMASRATPVEKSRAALRGDEPKAFDPTLQNQARLFALHEARTRDLID